MKVSGKVNIPARYKAGVIKIVEIINYHLSVSYIFGISSTLEHVAINDVTKHTIIPNAEIKIG